MKRYLVEYIDKDGYPKWFYIITNNFWEDIKTKIDKRNDVDYIISIKII